MRKIWMLARREYRAAVRTKGFIIGLLVAPLFMGGSVLAMYLLKDQVDTTDRRVAVIDRSGLVADSLLAAADRYNASSIHDAESGEKVRPAYIFSTERPTEGDPQAQRLALSDRVRAGELYAFVEIGPQVLHPDPRDTTGAAEIRYYAKNASMDETRSWMRWPINNHLRRTRLIEVGVDEEVAGGVFDWRDVTGFGLLTRDEETGGIRDARQSSEGEAILIPIVMVMLMFLMVMMGAMPQLSSVMEEKNQRIAEVLLGSVKPVEFMWGKVLGGVGVALTASLVYVAGGVLAADRFGAADYIPYEIIPWFFGFMILAITMFGAVFASLGSACNDAKEAQSLTFPAMLPIMIPMFVLMPVLREPQSTFATALSLFPPCTPMLMLLRMSSQEGVPAWQPYAGLVGVVLFTALAVWAGGRVFRIAILMQGTPPKIGNIFRWALRG